MQTLINNSIRLLFGALLVYSSFLYSNQVSQTTFLFCLEPKDSPLEISRSDLGYEVNNSILNKTLHDIGIVNIEPWIPNATNIDKHGDVFLNRIYRAYVGREDNIPSIMNLLTNSYSLLYAEHENIHKPHYTPNDPSYDQQCSMSSVKADKAWDLWDIPEGVIPDGQEIILASVDTGVDYTHPDLKGSLWINQSEIPLWAEEAGIDLNGDGYISSVEIEEFLIIEGMDNNADGEINLRDLVCEGSGFLDGIDADGNGYTDDLIGWDPSGYIGTDDADPFPREDANVTGTWAHGTHVAGILAATTDNSIGMASTSYNAKIMSVKCSRDYQQTDPGINDGYAAITYAATAGYHAGTFTIINNSWGGGGYSWSENSVIQNAHDTYGAIVLSSAGNGDDPQGNYSKEYPAAYDNVLSVSAIGCSGVWGGWATYHETVDLAAPGESILSAIIGQGYEAWDGSSMACPNAASAIGLLRAYFPNWDNDQLIDRILLSSDKFIYDLNPNYVNCSDNNGDEVECLDENSNPADCNCLGAGMVDAYAAIAIDFSPNISFSSYSYEITDGDGDDVLNPGDSFNLTITLENEEGWADANSIQVDLNCTDQSVSLSNSQFNFNLLEAGEVFTNDSSIEVVLGNDISLDDIDFIINVTAIGSDSYNYSENLSFSIPISLMQSGYPYDTNSQVDSSPLIVDLDGDSSLEIIFGDYADSIQVLSYSGQPIISDIFPYGTQDDIWSSAASADIDLDGVLDFAITSKDKNLYVLDQNGLKFTYLADQFLIGTPVIGNIDADDELEIVFGGNDSSGDIFAVNHDGTSVAGFPVEMNEKIWSGFALADFNGNGLDDIVVATDGEDFIGVCYDDGNLDTLFVAGNKFRNSPSIVKVNDSYIVMAGSDDDSMYGVSSSGELVFEVETGGNVRSSASFVNIDGQAYAFFGSDDELLYAVDMNGDALAGWPQDVGGDVDDAVSFADLDGDGDPEAIIGVSNKVYAYHMDGSLYDRFPISYEFSFTSPPVIKDLDLDGDLEITLGSSGSVVSIDIMEQGSLSSFGIPYWNQGSADNRRTSYYEIQEVECGSPMDGDLNCDGYSDVLDIVTILDSILNGSDLTLYEAWASDINGDGNIDVLDVVGIVNMIISG